MNQKQMKKNECRTNMCMINHWIKCCLLLAVILICSILVNFSIDFISDTYHIRRVEKLVLKGIDIKNNDQFSEEEKSQALQSVQDMAHGHNQKVIRRMGCVPEAIDRLDVELLRYENMYLDMMTRM